MAHTKRPWARAYSGAETRAIGDLNEAQMTSPTPASTGRKSHPGKRVTSPAWTSTRDQPNAPEMRRRASRTPVAVTAPPMVIVAVGVYGLYGEAGPSVTGGFHTVAPSAASAALR